jgi:hypothetical protein
MVHAIAQRAAPLPSAEARPREIGLGVNVLARAVPRSGASQVRVPPARMTCAPEPPRFSRSYQMSHTEKRHSLCGAHVAQLAVVLDRMGDVALANELRISRQTIARAVAGMRLNSTSRAVLESYLGSIAA